jgi:hypothetical protein
MRAYRVKKKVSAHGKINLEAVPFEDGELVEVIVLARDQTYAAEDRVPSLKGSVLEYINPTEPVAQDDWSTLQ